MADTLAFGLLMLVLLAAAVADARTERIPKAVTYGGLVVGLAFWTVTGLLKGGFSGAASYGATALLACAAGYVPFAIIFAAGGLGGGDVKLMAAVGAVSASWKLVIATAVYAFLVMFVMAIFVMIRRRIVGRTLKRIATAALMAVSRVSPDMPTDSPRIPFAVACCVGGAVAGIEHLLQVQLPWTDFGP
jgi:prepilin peptidase CpaA